MKEDLYGVLGLGPDATPEELKAAHRRAVRRHHPDAGGDSAVFHAVQRAYGVLSDPGRREHYDRTGRVDDTDPVARQRAQAMNLAAQTVMSIIGEISVDLGSVDVIGLARERLRDNRRTVEGRIEECRSGVARFSEFLRRLKRKEQGGVDNLRTMSEAQIKNIEGMIAQLEDEMKVVAQARELIEEYVYSYDQPQTGWVHMGNPATQPPRFFDLRTP